jgi:hypothetical protein
LIEQRSQFSFLLLTQAPVGEMKHFVRCRHDGAIMFVGSIEDEGVTLAVDTPQAFHVAGFLDGGQVGEGRVRAVKQPAPIGAETGLIGDCNDCSWRMVAQEEHPVTYGDTVDSSPYQEPNHTDQEKDIKRSASAKLGHDSSISKKSFLWYH